MDLERACWMLFGIALKGSAQEETHQQDICSMELARFLGGTHLACVCSYICRNIVNAYYSEQGIANIRYLVLNTELGFSPSFTCMNVHDIS